jgi:hypothetical protein
MWHTWERGEKCTGFWWESLKERDHLKNKGADGRMGSKWILGRLVGGVWSGFTWLRIRTGGRIINAVLTFWFWRHGVNYLVAIRATVCS